MAHYDALGQVITQTDALSRKIYTQYDAMGRPLTVTVNYVNGVYSGGTPDQDLQTVASYDAAGDRLSVRDPKSITTHFQYDLLGHMTVVTDAITGTTHYAFSAAGNVITITDALSHNTTMAYDLLDRQTRQTDALTHTTVYTYNAASNRTKMTDALGQTTVFTYNLNNQLTDIDYPAGTADVAFGYNGAGERTVMTDGLGTTTWTYDQMGRPITVTDPFSAAVGYVYDSAGNRLTLTYPDCRVAHYVYDLANRLTQVSSLCQDSASNSYAYDVAGRLITTTLANGLTSVYGYDAADRLKTLTHSQLGWTLGAYTYTVDASGNRTGVVESLQAPDALPGTITTTVISYTYDNLYRLTAANYSSGQVFTYTYDLAGNRLADGSPTGVTTYTYDIANRLTTINGGISYTWDANGNLLDNGQGVTYTYDAANRLVTVAGGQFSYSYDGLDNRLLQVANGTPITYTNDTAGALSQVLVEQTPTGGTTYLYGLSRLAQQSPASTDYFLDDGLGSVRQLADASGDVTLQKNYEPFGRTLASQGSGSTPYGFAGEYQDPTAFYYLRARYYTSRRGRFVSKDSVVSDYTNPQSLDRWAYVLDNSVNLTDPSGMVACTENQPLRYCALNNGGWLDYDHFHGSNGQAGDLIRDLQSQYGMSPGQVTLSNGIFGIKGAYSHTYYTHIPSPLPNDTLRSVAFGIFIDFQTGFEGFQGVDPNCYFKTHEWFLQCSSFSNEDLPSDYLGFLSASEFVIYNRSLNFDQIVQELGGGQQSSDEPYWTSDAYNAEYDCTLRLFDSSSGKYQNVPWTDPNWYITPVGRGIYWFTSLYEFMPPNPNPAPPPGSP